MSESQERSRKPSATSVTPLFHVIFISISLIIISGTLYYKLGTFESLDTVPVINQITPTKLKEFGGFPAKVTTGLYLDQFPLFDMIKNEFTFSGIVWFVFNSDAISLNTLKKFAFERGEILYRSEPNVEMHDKQLLVRYHIIVKFTTPLNFRDFPLDSHKISLTLTHPFITPSEFLFESTEREITINPDIRTPGWKIFGVNVDTGYLQAMLDPFDSEKTLTYPAMTITLDLIRAGSRYVMSIFMPLLLIFYLNMFSFSLRSKESVGLAIGSITATLAYRFVIENLSPITGDFMNSDYLFFIFLASNALIFLFTIMDAYAMKFSQWHKKLMVIALHTLVVGVTLYLFLSP